MYLITSSVFYNVRIFKAQNFYYSNYMFIIMFSKHSHPYQKNFFFLVINYTAISSGTDITSAREPTREARRGQDPSRFFPMFVYHP